jgi:AbrB family looped-hinge helix DNA binding protein
MDVADVTLAARGQIVIPKEARDALGLKPGTRLSVRVEGSRLLIEKRVTLDLSRWIGKAVNDGLTTEQALTELRGRPVPWQADDARAPRPASKRTGTGKRKGKGKAPRA